MSAFGINANFNEPQSDDTTSAPAVQVPPVQQPTGQKKKRKGFGPTVRNSGALAAAISRAKRARQPGDKYGA